jgi:phospholipase C
MMVATYTVRPGDTLDEEFPLSYFADGRYLIDVHGPNGFYRSFAGDPLVAAITVRISYERRASLLTGNLRAHLRNSSERPLTVALQDNAYNRATVTRTIAAGREAFILANLKQSYGWYDFTVKAEGLEAQARFAGRVETGRPSFSDPSMGGVYAR